LLIIVDPLNNEQIVIDFRPLYEAMHIYASLNKADELQRTYEADRRKQMDLLLPSSVQLDEDGVQLHDLLAEVTGFSIIERATSAKLPDFRAVSQIEGLWDLMCTQVIDLISDAVSKINDPKVLLTVKDSVTLFMQTIQVFDRRYLPANIM
jgi:exocyst complex component 6